MEDVFILAYMDYFIVCHNDKIIIKDIASGLNKEKHLGYTSYYLGIPIESYKDGSFLLSQKQKIIELLNSLVLKDANPMTTAMETDFHKQKEFST